MVTRYVPRAGDIVWINFDPQVGREQAKRRPALVITEEDYNRASGLAVVCAITSRRKSYPFEIPVVVGKVEGAVLADHIKSFDWTARKVSFHSNADPVLLGRVRAYVARLLGIS
ncbi:MAG TPA: type II toxin-antitoxin system PemK/MazF family toxin [Terriglobales bacterium]|jgi:mRNA interferase MazF